MSTAYFDAKIRSSVDVFTKILWIDQEDHKYKKEN